MLYRRRVIVVCVCKAVRESDVALLFDSGVDSPEELVAALELDDPECCGRCIRRVSRFFELPCAKACQAAQQCEGVPDSPALVVG